MSDNGCELHPDCLTCLFPDCIVGTNGQIPEQILRKYKIYKLLSLGYTNREIAHQIGVTAQTVYRYERLANKEGNIYARRNSNNKPQEINP